MICVNVYPSIPLPPRVFVRQWEDVMYEFYAGRSARIRIIVEKVDHISQMVGHPC